jgi:uncharacterized protein YjbI with pentapeptide repeats
MATSEVLEYARRGRDAWNAWRCRTSAHVDLSSADLSGMDLSAFDFSECDLRWTGLRRANCEGCNFANADLMGANLRQATLVRATFRESDLRWTHLMEADLRGADLRGALLQGALLLKSDLRGADLRGSRIFGVSAWGVILDDTTKQSDLVISSFTEPLITVDNIEVAQFIYLMLNNQKVRDVIDTITSKVVLILGRFTPERKQVLDGLRNELRKRNYLPVMFDFEKPTSQTTDETITLLARMARFIVADVSDAKSILQELRGIVPDLPSVAVQPLILIPQEEPGMFDFIRKYPWVLEPYRYDTQVHLLANLGTGVLDPAEAKVLELRGATPPRTGSGTSRT